MKPSVWLPAAIVALAGCVQWDPKISAGELLGAIVTLALGVLAARLAGQLSDRRKYLVEIISSDLAILRGRVDAIEAFFESATRSPRPLHESQQILSVFRGAINFADHIHEQLQLFEFSRDAIELANDLPLLLMSFRRDSTGQRFPIDNFMISPAQRATYERSVRSLRLAISKVARALVV